MQLERFIRLRNCRAIEIHAILQRRHQSALPSVKREPVVRLELRSRALREEHVARANRPALAVFERCVLDQRAARVFAHGAIQRAGANLRTLTQRELRDRSVEFFARRRMTGSKEDFVLLTASVEQRQTRRIAMHDGARKIERSAEPGAQAGRADAFFANRAVFLKDHDRQTGPCRLARRRTARRAATDNEKIDRLSHLGHCIRASATYIFKYGTQMWHTVC